MPKRRPHQAATASRSSGRPCASGYLDVSPTASTSAARISAGVGSRGSPTPKSISSTPLAATRRFATSTRSSGECTLLVIPGPRLTASTPLLVKSATFVQACFASKRKSPACANRSTRGAWTTTRPAGPSGGVGPQPLQRQLDRVHALPRPRRMRAAALDDDPSMQMAEAAGVDGAVGGLEQDRELGAGEARQVLEEGGERVLRRGQLLAREEEEADVAARAELSRQ